MDDRADVPSTVTERTLEPFLEALNRGTTTDGRAIRVRGCHLFEFQDGKIARKVSFWKIV
jgi:ketosteroid isomerase-like protein